MLFSSEEIIFTTCTDYTTDSAIECSLIKALYEGAEENNQCNIQSENYYTCSWENEEGKSFLTKISYTLTKPKKTYKAKSEYKTEIEKLEEKGYSCEEKEIEEDE